MPVIDKEIIRKFDVPGPRYTSYPTAPEWSETVNEDVYQRKLRAFGESDRTLSLYIHIPFCQSLCYFCACNVVIRPHDEKYGDEYLDHLSLEIDLVARSIGRKKTVKQFHWGGGTPTFLTERQIERLFTMVRSKFDIDPSGEIAIEIDPRTIDRSKVRKLRELGFNRVSMGIQDFNPEVQEAVNRRQPYEIVQEFNDWCRALQFHSVNFDLIYGLPHQTLKQYQETIEKVIRLRPDRIALYSFAYVPWLKKHQEKFSIDALPGNDEKLDIFMMSRARLIEAGYQAIAMDHFALENDELAKAFRKNTLYRNFMGYTVKPADEYVGLGITSIGFLEKTFIQNHKTLRAYFADLKMGRLPVERGKELSLDDQVRQWVISSLMCHFRVSRKEFSNIFHQNFDAYFQEEGKHLRQCEQDGLLNDDGEGWTATELGKLFIRNICMGFDWYLRQTKAHRKFSRTV